MKVWIILSLLFATAFSAIFEYPDYDEPQPTEMPHHGGDDQKIQKGCLAKLKRSDGCINHMEIEHEKGERIIIHGKQAFGGGNCPLEGSHMDHIHILEEPECHCPYCDPSGIALDYTICIVCYEKRSKMIKFVAEKNATIVCKEAKKKKAKHCEQLFEVNRRESFCDHIDFE